MLKNWLHNLKIKAKLMVILVITILHFLLFYAFSTFLLNTTSVYTSLIDAERMHTQYFETGLASFYMYLNNGDTAKYNQSISNIRKANRLASLMVNIDSVVKNTSKTELENIFWDYYKTPLHNDRNAVNMLASRTRLFVKKDFKILMETFANAAEGSRVSDEIVGLLQEYKKSPAPEDNPINQKVSSVMIKQIGYDCDIANNREVALSMHQENNYDIILMDILMPVMDGIEATKQIRKREKVDVQNKPTTIIALTANVFKEDVEMYIKSGMDYYLSKPLRIKDILNVLYQLYK